MKKLYPLVIFLLAVSCMSSVEKKSEPTTAEVVSEQIDVNHNPEAKLKELGIELKAPGTPKASYVHAIQTGNLLFLAGKGPKKPEGDNVVGKLGVDLTIEEGYEAARLAGISQLAVLKAELGNLNKVKQIVKVKGMVNAGPEFKDQSKVINGYSDLMVEVFGERGKHARAAVGMGSLPGNMAVEVEMIVEVQD